MQRMLSYQNQAFEWSDCLVFVDQSSKDPSVEMWELRRHEDRLQQKTLRAAQL